jgi:hypothetical protein
MEGLRGYQSAPMICSAEYKWFSDP